MGADKSRLYMSKFHNNEKQRKAQLLDRFLKNEPSAARGNVISELLVPSWNEPRNAYKL